LWLCCGGAGEKAGTGPPKTFFGRPGNGLRQGEDLPEKTTTAPTSQHGEENHHRGRNREEHTPRGSITA